jgi:hypothetical protein
MTKNEMARVIANEKAKPSTKEWNEWYKSQIKKSKSDLNYDYRMLFGTHKS